MSRVTEQERQTLYKQFQDDINEMPLAELDRFQRKFADAAFSGKTVTGDLTLDTVCASYLNRHHEERLRPYVQRTPAEVVKELAKVGHMSEKDVQRIVTKDRKKWEGYFQKLDEKEKRRGLPWRQFNEELKNKPIENNSRRETTSASEES